jgi:hypothetical protein
LFFMGLFKLFSVNFEGFYILINLVTFALSFYN